MLETPLGHKNHMRYSLTQIVMGSIPFTSGIGLSVLDNSSLTRTLGGGGVGVGGSLADTEEALGVKETVFLYSLKKTSLEQDSRKKQDIFEGVISKWEDGCNVVP